MSIGLARSGNVRSPSTAQAVPVEVARHRLSDAMVSQVRAHRPRTPPATRLVAQSSRQLPEPIAILILRLQD